jgi:hypothetical protein
VQKRLSIGQQIAFSCTILGLASFGVFLRYLVFLCPDPVADGDYRQAFLRLTPKLSTASGFNKETEQSGENESCIPIFDTKKMYAAQANHGIVSGPQKQTHVPNCPLRCWKKGIRAQSKSKWPSFCEIRSNEARGYVFVFVSQNLKERRGRPTYRTYLVVPYSEESRPG